MIHRTHIYRPQAALFLALSLAASIFGTVTSRALDLDLSSSEATLGVGDDLVVSWAEGPVEALLDVELLDQDGEVVSYIQVQTDDEGVLASRFLWLGTGISGCHICEESTPYTFEFHADAEASLLEQTFRIEVRQAEAGDLISALELRFFAQDELFFLSDADGRPCAQFRFEDNIYLSGRDNSPSTEPIRFFLISSENSLEIGAMMEDVRSEFEDAPQLLEAALPGPPVPLAIVLPKKREGLEGSFRGMVRRGSLEEPEIQESDQPADSPWWEGEITALLDPSAGAEEDFEISKCVVVYPYPKPPAECIQR